MSVKVPLGIIHALTIIVITIIIITIIIRFKNYLNPLVAGILIAIPIIATRALNISSANSRINQIQVYLVAIIIFIGWYFYLITSSTSKSTSKSSYLYLLKTLL